MSRNRSPRSPRVVRRDRARRWKRSKLTVALVGGPVILAVVAGSVFAAGSRHHRRQGDGEASAQPASAGTPNADCTLIVPEHPLTARGLATPYELVATDPAKGACHESHPDQAAFVEAAILTKDGKLTVYNPLVVDKGTKPAARPVRPSVPAGSTVGIWFGFNSANLTLRTSRHSNSLAQGKCVNGVRGSVFGQFAYCNAPAFFRAADDRIAHKQLAIPALGTAKDGLPCPTTRDFSVVDQDGSDNVVTHYLADARGRIAQNNAASARAMSRARRMDNRGDRHHHHDGRTRSAQAATPSDLANGSDNLLLTQFMDPALGCKPFTAPNQSSDGRATSALALDELSAAANQKAPIALIPQNDPMTRVDGRASVEKTNAYRAGVGMPALGADGDGDGAAYCRTLFGDPTGIQRIFKDKSLFEEAPSPDPATAPNLFAFLAARASGTFDDLGCDTLLGVSNPVALTADADGRVTDGVLTPLGQTPPAPGTADPGTADSASPTASASSSSSPAGDRPTASAPSSAGPSASVSAPDSAPASVPASASASGGTAKPSRWTDGGR
ncbi:hypothetical protein JS756_11615 [Streptomyces actuosus]|uniref:Uncharacterized protein n=1 Tax=Streptomyces actuosus TaxID=1885 RepID=A0ABS2VNY9_STRAS|nr:hypothetical protein [Streptomyces actuosus]MBN0044745.1 hypothetical protein [Streptomyces actuosus]